jgi:hypothetical protein
MGNYNNQKLLTKDVACQVEFLTRKNIKRCNDNDGDNLSPNSYIVKKSANVCTKYNTLLNHNQKDDKKTVICGNCKINLDQGIKVFLEPCKHMLCILCYNNIYWKGEHFSLSSAVLQSCYRCKSQLLYISTDTEKKIIKIRHSLCSLNDYVIFYHKDKVLQFVDLPQVNLPYHYVLSFKYFPLDTPQPVQEDIIAYISMV